MKLQFEFTMTEIAFKFKNFNLFLPKLMLFDKSSDTNVTFFVKFHSPLTLIIYSL